MSPGKSRLIAENSSTEAPKLIDKQQLPTISFNTQRELLNPVAFEEYSSKLPEMTEPLKAGKVALLKFGRTRHAKQSSLYQSTLHAADSTRRSLGKTTDWGHTADTVSAKSKHTRVKSDILTARVKLDDFLKTDAFSKIYKDDTYRLLKIHHKLMI